MDDVTLRYFDWLKELVDENDELQYFSSLMNTLFDIPFEWFIPLDDNRAEDGCLLRDEFCDIVGTWRNSRFVFEPCTFLEMLIALSKRLEYESDLTEMDGSSAMWFWRMLHNVGLDYYSDINYQVYPGSEDKVRRIVEIIINREYKRNGVGGLFPLAHPRRDQRRTELWSQASAYLLENSDIGS